jgi:predicted nucleic acid-binding protein
MSAADGQITAVAPAYGLTLATRNTGDFEPCGIATIDPWA